MKRFTHLLTIIMLLIGISPVFANTTNNIVNFSKKGIITITLSDGSDNGLVEGANIKLYKLADAYSENYNLAFSYHKDLEKCENNIKENDLNEKTLECIYNSRVFNEEKTTDNLGYTSFNDLDLGLYLIEQTNKVEGYSKIDPFLVYIPQFEENSWIYEVNATPKVDVIRLFDLSVEKVWNVGSDSDIPNEVTVELLRNGEVIDSVILNQKNNWEYTWNQIEKSDEYSVKEINVPAGFTDTYRQVENKFIITNTKTLVQTGLRLWLVELFSVIGVILVVVGIVCEKRNKYE